MASAQVRSFNPARTAIMGGGLVVSFRPSWCNEARGRLIGEEGPILQAPLESILLVYIHLDDDYPGEIRSDEGVAPLSIEI